MGILEQLGINQTYFFQFFIFILTLILLGQLVFKDFLQLIERREKLTSGGEQIAAEEHKKASELQATYETKARAINGDIKAIYDEYRDGASKEYEKIVGAARADSLKLVETSRHNVSLEIAEAARKLKEEVPGVAQTMVGKLLSPQAKA